MMLTKLTLSGFKRFDRTTIELGNPVLFVGPNNSGKTTALQALALWDVGLRRWNEKRKGKKTPEKRPGVTINRRDLIALPVPNANLLWRDLHVRDVTNSDGNVRTSNVRIEITVDGVSDDQSWTCGLEFDYANEQSFYCRPLRISDGRVPARMPIPDVALSNNLAFLPPMSGLAANETRLDPGAINVRIGEGRTAEVLRNLCFTIYDRQEGSDDWKQIRSRIHALFGVQLDPPSYVAERGEITMTYMERGTRLDLSCSGRGLQQVLLLLAYLHANPKSVLLLDEPDAHLEILRQRQVYNMLTDVAHQQGSQIIAASHSEVLLNEAADKDVVVAFVGKPHRIDDRGSQAMKSLKEIGFDQYFQAEQRGWVLYLEGATDLAILRAFAIRLNHDAAAELDSPFVHYVCNQPKQAERHYFGLRDAIPHLRGFALFDQIDRSLPENPQLTMHMWSRKEIENYLCQRVTLMEFAIAQSRANAPGPIFEESQAAHWQKAMEESMAEFLPPAAARNPGDKWWTDTKITDEYLDRVFEEFYRRLEIPELTRKSDYHELAQYVPIELIDGEIVKVLDIINTMAKAATPSHLP